MDDIINIIKSDYSGYFFKKDLRSLLTIRKSIRRFLKLSNIDVLLLINNFITISNKLSPERVYYYLSIILNEEELEVIHSILFYIKKDTDKQRNRIMDDILSDLHKNYIRYRINQ